VEPPLVLSLLGEITAKIDEGSKIHLEKGEIPSMSDEFKAEPP